MNRKTSTHSLPYKSSVFYFPLVGIIAIIWFLVRVIPKPQRASYPCQQVAAGVGGSFIAYLVGILGLAPLWHKLHKIKSRLVRYRTAVIVVLSIALGLTALLVASKYIPSPSTPGNSGFVSYVPVDSPNQPMGVARGLYPGRLVWIQDRQATLWDGSTGFWWTDSSTDQTVVDSMLSRSLLLYTGEPDIGNAWEAIFQHFNQEQGRGPIGYQAGEKIVIKINCNQDTEGTWDNGGFNSPHLIYSLVSQLINVVGVAGADITIADPSRYIGDPIYNKIRANPDQDFQAVNFVVKPTYARNGRIGAEPDYTKPIHFVKPYPDDPNITTHYPPRCYTQATYLINLALLRCHGGFGVTLCTKNHFGSVHDGAEFRPWRLHGSSIAYNQMGDPHCHPVLLGHRELGGKTLLYMIDGLYTAIHQGSKTIVKWKSLGMDWCSSLLVSQDPLAIDSAALDFLRSEPNMQVPVLTEDVCNYLHESALADNPPSQAFYDPDNDGTRVQSLGTHEHWNNAVEKMYSRNLGTGDGIELIKDCSSVYLLSPDGGEVWQKGSSHRISWRASKLKAGLRITLWKDGKAVGIIATNVDPGLGTYTWRVGEFKVGAAEPGPGYRIKLKEQNYGYSDLSDADFAIAEMILLTPNGGGVLKKGSSQQITWQASGFTAPVKIFLWKDKTKIGIIARNLPPGPGTYNWRVGDYIGGSSEPGPGYRIVVVAGNLKIYDYSDSAFTIVN